MHKYSAAGGFGFVERLAFSAVSPVGKSRGDSPSPRERASSTNFEFIFHTAMRTNAEEKKEEERTRIVSISNIRSERFRRNQSATTRG